MKANTTLLMQTPVANAVKTALSAGSGAKKLAVYSGTIPATAGAAVTTQVKLLEYTITPGSWAVTDGVLVVPSSSPVNGLANGIATWGRFIDGDEAVVMDVDVTSSGGNGFIRLTRTDIALGAPCAMVAGTIHLA